ncbi:pyridoxal phosphate-dependent aminotransferase [Kitasatospora sp. HPMI-4]|uniref:pyridoxal phosphate-dependent aminotransferase n=1 Tax=Kitasatospora sp. HPMI-4 TaxID=3448443 RepID=UPI003F1E3A6D
MTPNSASTKQKQRHTAPPAPKDIASVLAGTHDLEQALAFYHRFAAPDVDNLSVAENCLVYEDSLQMQVFKNIKLIDEKYINYLPAYGEDDLRQWSADLLGHAFGTTVKKEHVYGTAGVASALECLAFGLKGEGTADDPPPLRDGDAVLLPAPYWQGFNWSFEQRPKLTCVPVNLPTSGNERFKLTLKLIQDTYGEYQKKKGKAPRLLVLTNPQNPLGVNYPKELLEEIYTWVMEKTEMHIISDEIYCFSQISGSKPAFVSALKLDAYRKHPNRVHVVWGFAKDFGLSGFRTGFLVSGYDPVRRVMEGSKDDAEKRASLSWFSPFDSLKQYVIEAILTAKADGDKSEPYTTYAMKRYGGLLTKSFQHVKDRLDANKIKYVHDDGGNAAQFFWLDLTDYLKPKHHDTNGAGSASADLPLQALNTRALDPREDALFHYLVEKAQVTLLPGGVMSCPTPGFFRLCYTALPAEKVGEAVDRVAKALNSW